jgi:hypothetical protein
MLRRAVRGSKVVGLDPGDRGWCGQRRSNAISERLGYEPNGLAWATHQGEPVFGKRWRLLRETWAANRPRSVSTARNRDIGGSVSHRRNLAVWNIQ